MGLQRDDDYDGDEDDDDDDDDDDGDDDDNDVEGDDDGADDYDYDDVSRLEVTFNLDKCAGFKRSTIVNKPRSWRSSEGVRFISWSFHAINTKLVLAWFEILPLAMAARVRIPLWEGHPSSPSSSRASDWLNLKGV